MKKIRLPSLQQDFKDIIQHILAPSVAGILFFVWVYFLITAPLPVVYVFPLGVLLIFALYYVSGHIHAGVLLGFEVVVGFFCIFFSATLGDRFRFFLETLWMIGFFWTLERFRRTEESQINLIREETEVFDTRITLLESRINESRLHSGNLRQRIATYQLLGRMVQELSSTLEEEKLLDMVGQLAGRCIGRGTWKVKKGVHNDLFARYVKTQAMPLIISDLSRDNRFPLAKTRFASLVAVPLDINGKFWGIIKGVAAEPHAFDEDDLRILSVLSALASLALNNTKLYQQTQELAITDSLTGLYVQSYFRERLAEEILRSRSHQLPLTVAMLDIDFFKAINDSYGHPAGDIVLRQVSTVMRGRLRETDFISRYGGEEFGIIMPQTDLKEATRVVDQIRTSIEAERFYLPIESFHPVQAHVTVSAGLAGADHGTLFKDEELLRRADEALYRAKNAGRNRVEISL